jgi:ABC-type dipeptide/oligopeptide/nickel transport system permease component
MSHGSFFRFAVRRLALLLPQLFVVVTVAFVLVRVIPGDPAARFLGGNATREAIQQLRIQFGLTKPIATQYWEFLRDLPHGDLGNSWTTSQSVVHDIGQRFPVTLQLITLSMAFSLLIALPVGVSIASLRRGRVARATGGVARAYGLLAGAMPEFWLGLILLFVFFVKAHVAPGPLGLLGLTVTPPPSTTGFVLLDSVIHGNWAAFGSVLAHLALPVATLTFVTTAALLRMTVTEVGRILESDFVRYVRALGVRERTVYRYALQTASGPILTLAGILYAFLLGGAVLVERIFALGGFGQYGVDAVLSSDYPALLGFVTVAGVFAFAVYLVLDLVQAALDPRRR